MAITVIDAIGDSEGGDAAITAAIAGVVGNAPASLNTLGKLGDAIGDDASFSATVAEALGLKAPLSSPTFTGTPLAPTPAANDNTTKIATTAFVAAAIAALVNSAPGTLDTLNELAAALGSDPNFATTVTNALAAKAPLDSPALTGTPTAPTAAGGTNNTQIATTAFVVATLAAKAALDSPTFTGTPSAPTAVSGTNTTQLATTAFVTSAIAALIASAPGALDTLNELATALGNDANFATTMTNALAAKAPLASPGLTGTPTAPTAGAGTNTTQIATTAFVNAAVTALVNSAPAALDTLVELATALGNDANFATTVTNALAAKAPLESPALTGTPTAPTAAGGTNTTQVATTAFVTAAVAGATSGSAVVTAVGVTLSNASHNNSRIIVTATGQTITIPDAATLGFFECEIVADGYSVILDGPGATNVTLADGEVATVFTANSKVRLAKGPTTVIS